MITTDPDLNVISCGRRPWWWVEGPTEASGTRLMLHFVLLCHVYTWFRSAIWLVPPEQGTGSLQLLLRMLPGSLPPRFWGESLGTRLMLHFVLLWQGEWLLHCMNQMLFVVDKKCCNGNDCPLNYMSIQQGIATTKPGYACLTEIVLTYKWVSSSAPSDTGACINRNNFI